MLDGEKQSREVIILRELLGTGSTSSGSPFTQCRDRAQALHESEGVRFRRATNQKPVLCPRARRGGGAAGRAPGGSSSSRAAGRGTDPHSGNGVPGQGHQCDGG